MARTGIKDSQSSIARISSDLATLGSDLGYSEKEMKQIFSSVAKNCTTRIDQIRFLRFVKASGLSPWKRDVFAIPYKGRIEFVTNYHVFMSRARNAGFIIRGQDVCEKDAYDGWDASNLRPINHVIPPKGRGKPMGAYAQAIDEKTHEIVSGSYWEASVLLSDNPNPLRSKIPGYFCWKTAVGRLARTVAPDLSSLYMAEEFGVLASTNPAEDQIPLEVRDVAQGDVVEQVDRQSEPSTVSDDIAAARGDIEDVEVSDGGDSGDEDSELDGDAKLPFKKRTAVMKAIAKTGNTSAENIGDYLALHLQRKVTPSDLTNADLVTLQAGGLEVES